MSRLPRPLLWLLLVVTVVGVADPAGAQIAPPVPPPVVAPPTVTPVPPPSGTIGEGSWCDQLGPLPSWFADQFGYCTGGDPPPAPTYTPPEIANPPRPFDGDQGDWDNPTVIDQWDSIGEAAGFSEARHGVRQTGTIDMQFQIAPANNSGGNAAVAMALITRPAADCRLAWYTRTGEQGFAIYLSPTHYIVQRWTGGMPPIPTAVQPAGHCNQGYPSGTGAVVPVVVGLGMSSNEANRRPWFRVGHSSGFEVGSLYPSGGSMLEGATHRFVDVAGLWIGHVWHGTGTFPIRTNTAVSTVPQGFGPAPTMTPGGGDGWQDPWGGLDQAIDDALDELPKPEVAQEPVPTSPSPPAGAFDPESSGNESNEHLGNRILGGLGSLLGGIVDALGWLGDRLTFMFEWLAEVIWQVARWFWQMLSGLLQLILQALNLVREAIIQFSQAVHALFTVVISWLGELWASLQSILSAIVGGFGLVVSGIGTAVEWLAGLFGHIAQLPSLLAQLPGLIVQGFVDVLTWLFVPTEPLWPPDEPTPPIVDTLAPIPPALEDLLDFFVAGGCGPSMNEPLPGRSETIGWAAPSPASSGCPGNGPGGARLPSDDVVGDLWGYRVAIRAAFAVTFVLAAIVTLYKKAPWEDPPESYEQLSLKL